MNRIPSKASAERGQSLVESALVVMMISLVFFGMLQVALKVNAEQVQQWATFAGARSRVVGFNDGVVQKAWGIANILNSGTMLAPSEGLGEAAQAALESAAIPLFLETQGTLAELAPQLNYTGWEDLSLFPPFTGADQFVAEAEQNFPLRIAQILPFLEASFGRSNVVLQTEVTLENHFPLYFQTD